MGDKRLAVVLLGLMCACGGDDWSSVSGGPTGFGVTDVWAFSETNVWVVDGTPDVYRYDGDGWTTLPTDSVAGLLCIFALSETDVYLCAGGEVLHYDGTSFTAMDISSTNLNGVTDIWATSASDVWAVGDESIAAHYDGTSWTGRSIGSSFNSSVWASGPDDVYVMGTFDLVHYDGSMWTEIDLDNGAGDGQVWGTSASDVWVMTDSYAMSHFDGSAWETIETVDFVGDLAAVWGPAPDDLWAAGSAGSIAHYDGDSWDEVTHQRIGAPYLRLFVAIHGSSSSNVWAVGRQLGEGGSTPIVYRYTP